MPLKTRIYRLAHELEAGIPEILSIARELDLHAKGALALLGEDEAEAVRAAWLRANPKEEIAVAAVPTEPPPPLADFDLEPTPTLRVLKKAPPKIDEPTPTEVETAAKRRDKKKKKKTQEALEKIRALSPTKGVSAGISARSERLLEFTRRAGLASTSAVYSNAARRKRQPTRPGAAQGAGSPGTVDVRAPQKVEISLPITVRDLSQAIGLKANILILKLLELGITVNVNSFLNDEETVQALGLEFECEITVKKGADLEEEAQKGWVDDLEADRVARAPVVAFLGHVDHGKTSLLDAIRKTRVTDQEYGGITQHLSAYKVKTPGGRTVVFLDTPGHEAFTEMRSRGANVTDVVVLVVAADDGVMPQTEEAVNHARAAEVPIVVALNKIDKPEANPLRVRQQLASLGLQSHDWGGSTEIREVSAVTGTGIEDLVETLALEADLLDLKANPSVPASGTVLEAKLSEGKGVLATLIVQNGTLHKGDTLVCGQGFGKIRNLWDDSGRSMPEAGPSTPVSVAGLSAVPEAGDRFYVVRTMQEAKEIAERRGRELRDRDLAEKQHVTLANLYSKLKEAAVKEIRVVLKADVKGSIEVLKKSLHDLSTDEIKVRILHAAVGAITESDVILADASDAVVIGFQVLAEEKARSLADKTGVDVRTYHVIYEVTDEVRKAMEGLLEPEEKEVVLGHAEVRQVFRASGLGNIAGCYVTDGKVERTSKLRLFREGRSIFEGALASLKRFKNDAREVKEGFECGLRIEGYDDVKEGDVLEFYEIQQVARKLV